MLINYDPISMHDSDQVRSHPWRKTEYNERPGFYSNFITNPELIPDVLEDFSPYADKPAVQTFYRFLRWINGHESQLETNDCALRDSVIDNPDGVFNFSHKIDGRVEFFYRDHKMNCRDDYVIWLFRMTSLYLQVERPDFLNGLITMQLAPTDFINLPTNESAGHRIRLSFHAYGNGDGEVWSALRTTFECIRKVTERLNIAMTEGPLFP